MFCINLALGLAISLDFPGTVYIRAANAGIDPSDAMAVFDYESIASSWSGNPFSGIPVVGDIFGGFSFLWSNIQYLLDGLPMLLTYLKAAYITSADGQLAFDVISNVLRAIYALLVTMFLIEFISGRIATD